MLVILKLGQLLSVQRLDLYETDMKLMILPPAFIYPKVWFCHFIPTS